MLDRSVASLAVPLAEEGLVAARTHARETDDSVVFVALVALALLDAYSFACLDLELLLDALETLEKGLHLLGGLGSVLSPTPLPPSRAASRCTSIGSVSKMVRNSDKTS